MAFVMITKEQLPFKLFSEFLRRPLVLFAARLCQLRANQVRHPKLLFHPERQGFEKGTEAGGSVIEIGFQQTIEFQQRLVVEAHVIKIVGSEVSFTQAITGGM